MIAFLGGLLSGLGTSLTAITSALPTVAGVVGAGLQIAQAFKKPSRRGGAAPAAAPLPTERKPPMSKSPAGFLPVPYEGPPPPARRRNGNGGWLPKVGRAIERGQEVLDEWTGRKKRPFTYDDFLLNRLPGETMDEYEQRLAEEAYKGGPMRFDGDYTEGVTMRTRGVSGFWGRRRRVNPLNLKALTRAGRRISRFATIAKRFIRLTQTKTLKPCFKRRRKCRA